MIRNIPLSGRRGITRRRAAFTIPEMLAVVAIVVVLIAMLMPSLAMGRYRAKSVACSSNKHQIVIGMRAYSLDNGNRFPNLPNYGNIYWMQDHPHNVFTVPQKSYSVPLEMWACEVSNEPRVAGVLPYHWGGYNPSQKWKMNHGAWWVIRGAGGAAGTVAGPLVSDRVQKAPSASVIVSDAVGGAATPSSSPHAFAGKVLEAPVARADGSSELIPAETMQVRVNHGWGPWWY